MADNGMPRRAVLRGIATGVAATGVVGTAGANSVPPLDELDSGETPSAQPVISDLAGHPKGTKQVSLDVPVSLYPDLPEDEHVRATLTLPPKDVRKPGVQVLIHGITYGRFYNDFPYKPDQYSYVRAATERGYTTLNIDRIGIYESSHPAPELITLDTNSWNADQITRKLKAGEIGAGREAKVAGERTVLPKTETIDAETVDFDSVTLVGHSYGSFISTQAQNRYGNADAIVLTGFSQSYGQGKPFVAPFQSRLTPAQQDNPERFGHLPPGYLTSKEGFRDSFYYNLGTEDRVIQEDEIRKQTVTDSEFASIPGEGVDSFGVTGPVLEINGDEDSYFCGVQSCSNPAGVSATEPSYWPNADFTLELVPGAGHDLYLHRPAPDAFEIILDWADDNTI